MPRVQRPAPIRLAAPVDAVRAAAVARLDAVGAEHNTVVIGAPSDVEPPLGITMHFTDDRGETVVSVDAPSTVSIPFFAFFFTPLVRVQHRRAVRHAVGILRNELEGAPPPAPEKPVIGLPPVPFEPGQAALLATASMAAAVVAFAAALFGQLADPISRAYHASNATISFALALTRIGVLFALFITALADRRGRRRSILICVVGSAIACAISAAAPNLYVFTGAQMLQRGVVITTATVAGIAVIEEAPEGARAYALSMLALAGGLGFSIAVVLLPFGDIGGGGWRIPFAIGALTIGFAPVVARNLRETTRYEALVARTDVVRGRFKDVFHPHYSRRFMLLAVVAFLTSVFSAPSSSLMNKYLTDVHHFSNTHIALFRTVTTALPGLAGLLIGGRLAEARGRRPVAAAALLVATGTQMIFFLGGGALIWVMSAVSILAAGASGIAIGTLDAELFPTETRSTSNAFLVVLGVAGSVTGLLLAGGLSDALGGLGHSIALTGIAALVAAFFVLPLPESGAHALDEVSPTEYVRPHEPEEP
jgi:MFS family permease